MDSVIIVFGVEPFAVTQQHGPASTRTAQIGVKSRIHFALEVRTSCRKSVVARLCLVVLTMRVRVREYAY